jgi:flagellin-like protein
MRGPPTGSSSAADAHGGRISIYAAPPSISHGLSVQAVPGKRFTPVQRPSKGRRLRARAIRSKRGVSEVVGTILILALTVTLFSSIFFFVNTFPKPAQQPTSQFQGQLYTSTVTKGTHTWTNVSAVTVTHLGGPTLYNFNTIFYVVSQAHPQNTTATYTLTSGGFAAAPSTSWGTGQVWNLSLAADHLSLPDNITVTVVSGSNVVYRQTLPGTNPTVPPIFDSVGTSPAVPVAGATFSIFAQISDPFLPTTSKQVYVNITTSGLSCTNPQSAYSANTTSKLQMTYNVTNGLWFLSGCSTSTSATYYVTIWVTDKNPLQIQSNSIIFPLFVSTSGSVGPTCSNTYAAADGQSPAAATSVGSGGTAKIYLNFTNGNVCDWIYVNATFSVSTGSIAPGTFGNAIVSAGGTLAITDTYTAPTLAHGTATATITITVSCPTGATATSPTTFTISVKY